MSAIRSTLHTATLPSGRQTVNHLTRPDDAVAESRQRTTVRLTDALRGGPAFQVTGEQGSRMTDDTERDGPGGPLHGLLVADFSRILAGPYATMLLGDMGAEVIKVESPGGDDTRSWLPPVRGDVSTYYLAVNRNKRSLALDLKDGTDAALARELAARADVVIENFKPGGLARFGLDYPAVRDVNPGVVYASISGFGSRADPSLPGYDLMVQAISGLMSLTGDPEGT